MDTIESTIENVEKYEFKTSYGPVVITFVESEDKLKFLIKGPKQIISKAIGGLGEENETEAWATEASLKTEAQRMYAVLETIKTAKENQAE